MNKKLLISAISAGVLFFSGCGTVMVPQAPDAATGLIKGASEQARVIIDKPFDLAAHKGIVLIPDGEFLARQTEMLRYFESIYNQDDFDRLLIQRRLSDRVQSAVSPLGRHRAYEALGPFVVLRLDLKTEDPKNQLLQLQVFDPKGAEIVFCAEVKLDFKWKGFGDRYTFYPLFNELIRWIKKNDQSPNQSLPTTLLGTSTAAQPLVPSRVVAHL